jgi:hypothetical protein
MSYKLLATRRRVSEPASRAGDYSIRWQFLFSGSLQFFHRSNSERWEILCVVSRSPFSNCSPGVLWRSWHPSQIELIHMKTTELVPTLSSPVVLFPLIVTPLLVPGCLTLDQFNCLLIGKADKVEAIASNLLRYRVRLSSCVVSASCSSGVDPMRGEHEKTESRLVLCLARLLLGGPL